MDGAANKVLLAKGSSKGLRHGQMVECFVLLSTLGGDCIDDMKRLRDDEGLAGILSYRPPAPETARQWLNRFHDEALMLGALDEAHLASEFHPNLAASVSLQSDCRKSLYQPPCPPILG